MATSSKAFIASFLIFSLFLHGVIHCYETMDALARTGRSLLQKIDCGAACDVRCSKSSRPNLCKRACGTCCARCDCVPPGTYGNEDVCPCYANMTTRGGRHKCP